MAEKQKNDLLVMKLLHYFITERNYSPVIVHGIQNEIWLENMDEQIRIVRIVMGYIHNKEQLEFDNFKVNRLTKQIKMKTFTFKMKTLSLYLDVNENVELIDTKNNYKVNAKDERTLKKSNNIKQYFADMMDKLKFTEEGAKLYVKINNDILRKNMDESEKLNDLFSPKKPIVTNILLGLITVFMILMYVFGNGSTDVNTLYDFGGLVKNGSFIRVFSSIFLHIGIVHFILNFWALKILGNQAENFYGHVKTLIIFLFSGVVGNLFSMLLMGDNVISAGASGAIFGLMGAILYFAINQRTYMGEALKNDILPVIIANLLLGFFMSGINIYAHLGGIIAGMMVACGLGIKHKSSKFERINGVIASLILVGTLTFLVYFN